MTFCQPEQVRRLRAIPLEAVLPLCGAQADRHDRHKWHTSKGVLSIMGPKFMNWTQGTGGCGAIDLVIHLNGLDFKAALDWLAHHFAGAFPAACRSLTPQPKFKLPPPDPVQLWRVKRYLVAERAIAPALIQSLIQSGRLYADHQANAVFPLFPVTASTADPVKPTAAVGAELRGTSRCRWRGLAPGSRKDLGCFGLPVSRPADGPVILCESAIDAISCFVLHPQHWCLSTAGARPNPAWLAPLLERGCQIYCGFDADPIGDDMARAMIALHPSVKRLRPCAHDWNDLLRAAA